MRRQIVLFLSNEGTATFTQIMDYLRLDPLWQCGTIGYHLNRLVESGLLRKHKDGYELTSEGRSIVDIVKGIGYLGSKKKLNLRLSSSEQVLDMLNERTVCWLLAVVKGVKPAATILSVRKDLWTQFLKVLNELDLCWSYEGIDGMVLTCQKDKADRQFGSIHMHSDDKITSLLFDDKEWTDLLTGDKSSFKVLNQSSARLEPIVYQNPNAAWELTVSRDLQALLTFARVNQRTRGAACLTDPVERGKALGYPECCIEAHVKGDVWGLVARHNFFKELIDLGLDDRMPVEFWAIAHIPCSVNCQESLKLGRKYLDAVRSYSSTLYDLTVKKLCGSYLAYSVGERFLCFEEVSQEEYSPELRNEYGVVSNVAGKLVSDNVKLALGNVHTPLIYSDYESYPIRLRLVPDLVGLKWIAYSPKEGMLVRDMGRNEIYLYGLLKWMLPNEYENIIDTVCRVYKCS